ncbi:hypothetical protein [Domibacillus aminovorans]|uniref:IrrE N-terminal-like domain-containing protein n=1 Tax=Domibacillus aminovorans TaxID=29332 RepID=A0A177L8B8_9BACI|nr:hypothetical protein [Domibacillus aminovorans]OAH61968.1 hypothetical protein AWH49_11140 [Domibacillus aminovorans]
MLPNKVKVVGIEYKVIEKDVVEINGNLNYSGGCFHREAEIQVRKDASKDRKEQIFIHELVHAILNEAGYDNHEEEMVERFGIVLHQVLKDNDLQFINKHKHLSTP